jgi:hypothetical protein
MKKYNCWTCGTELHDKALRAAGTKDYFCLCEKDRSKKPFPCHILYTPKGETGFSFENMDLSDPEHPTVIGDEGCFVGNLTYLKTKKAPTMSRPV